MNAGLLHVVDQAIIQAFKANGPELEDLRHMIASPIHVRIAQHEQ